ncbi:MAG: paraquat-inducible protein A, partial [Janthinobacterium lividum]
MLYRRRPVAWRERARCTRCESVLYRGTSVDQGRTGLTRLLAITLTALLTYLIAQLFPIVELELNGNRTSATLLGAIRILWHEHMEVGAALVFLSTILFPMLELGTLLYLVSGLRAGRKRRGFHVLLRLVQAVRHWAMIEVLMIGILVTVIKMTSLASVLFHPGLFGFAALTVLMAIVVRIEPRSLWTIGDQLEARAAFAPAAPAHALERPMPARQSAGVAGAGTPGQSRASQAHALPMLA